MGEGISLAEALPREVMRVIDVRDQYRTLLGQPRVVVAPQIAMMTAAISEAVSAGCSGDVVRMLRAYEALKAWEQ